MADDLISRAAAIVAIRELAEHHGALKVAADVTLAELPAVVPQVVANITGGVLQGASSDFPVDLYALDFDVDTFDEDSSGIVVEGYNAYLTQMSVTDVGPDFVREVIEAEEINFSTGEPVG
jgi:hypothetical protein